MRWSTWIRLSRPSAPHGARSTWPTTTANTTPTSQAAGSRTGTTHASSMAQRSWRISTALARGAAREASALDYTHTMRFSGPRVVRQDYTAAIALDKTATNWVRNSSAFGAVPGIDRLGRCDADRLVRVHARLGDRHLGAPERPRQRHRQRRAHALPRHHRAAPLEACPIGIDREVCPGCLPIRRSSSRSTWRWPLVPSAIVTQVVHSLAVYRCGSDASHRAAAQFHGRDHRHAEAVLALLHNTRWPRAIRDREPLDRVLLAGRCGGRLHDRFCGTAARNRHCADRHSSAPPRVR